MVRTMDKSNASSSATTVMLRACAFCLVVVSFIAAVLALTAVLLNSLITMSLETSISVTNTTTGISYTILPQIDATIGMTIACAGGTCGTRGTFTGPHSLLPPHSALMATLGASSQLPGLYDAVRNQFVLGYDIGNSCGTSTSTVRALSQLSLASGILAVVFLGAAAVLGTVFFSLVARRDVLVGVSTINVRHNCVMVGKEEILVDVVIEDLLQHLRFEKPFFIAELVSACMAVVFAVIAMAVTLSLTNSKMKCGKSFCSQLSDAIDSLVSEYRHYSDVRSSKYTCATGPSIPLFIVSFVLALLGLIGSITLLIVGMRTGRRRLLVDRLHCLTRQRQSLPMIVELELRQDSLSHPNKITLGEESKMTPVSPAYTHTSRGNSALGSDVRDQVAQPSWGNSLELPSGTFALDTPSNAYPVRARTLGSGIQLLKRRKSESPMVKQPPLPNQDTLYLSRDLDRVSRPLTRNPSALDITQPNEAL